MFIKYEYQNALNRALFSLTFSDIIEVYAHFHTQNIYLLVRQNCHKNIISCCVHTRVTQKMELKTQYRGNIRYEKLLKCRKIQTSSNTKFMYHANF